jgi:hypothetical protein
MRTSQSGLVDGRLGLLVVIAEVLELSARELLVISRRKWKDLRRRPRGGTLRPSELETPLWLALAAAVRPHLKKRGSRALLARELGVHRARVTEYFIRGHAMPDAERTLLLLIWLGKRRKSGVQSQSMAQA